MRGQTAGEFHESHFVPFKNAFRSSLGPYECADEGSRSEEASIPNLFSEANVIRSATTSSVVWGPNCTKDGKKAGFPNFGADISVHPRLYPDYQAQGLTGPHPLPRRTVGPLERANYDSQTHASLKLLCSKRKILVSGNKAALIGRLKQYDEKNEKTLEAKTDDGGDGDGDGDGDIEVAGSGAGGEDPLERANYDSQTNASLKILCSKRKILVSGNKAALIGRLKQYDEKNEKTLEAKTDDGGDGDGDGDGDIEVAGNGAGSEDAGIVNEEEDDDHDDDDDDDGDRVDDVEDKDDESDDERADDDDADEENDEEDNDCEDYFSTFKASKRRRYRL